MKILVKSRHSSKSHFEKEKYRNTLIIDLTSKATEPWVKFSPFYPIENVPIPFSNNQTAASVEGIWQGLKVFENIGIDNKTLENRSMKGLKRTIRRYGKVLGHQKGLDSTKLLPYIEARKQIFSPTYKWVLDNKLQKLVIEMKRQSSGYDQLILLDYETNGNIEDPKKPLSHAYLVKYYLENNYPVF